VKYLWLLVAGILLSLLSEGLAILAGHLYGWTEESTEVAWLALFAAIWMNAYSELDKFLS